MTFNPTYPNPAALAYRDAFIAGAESQQLSGIPEALLSRLIDAGIGHNWGAEEAGKVFARRFNHGITACRNVSWHDYVVAEFVKELERLQVLR